MDKAKVDRILGKYPELEKFIAAGIISLKAARTILDIDRWLMYDIFTDLLACGAVAATGAAAWKATPELKEYLAERREINGHSHTIS